MLNRKRQIDRSITFLIFFLIVYKYDFIPKPLTVDEGVNKVAFLLANTLVVSTSTSLEFLTNTADPGLWRGSLSESVLHTVTWKRFVSVGSWPAFPVTLDTKVRVVLHWRRPGAPRKFKGYDQILISPHNNNVLSQWQVMRNKNRIGYLYWHTDVLREKCSFGLIAFNLLTTVSCHVSSVVVPMREGGGFEFC